MWLLKSVYMERAAAGSGADWESVWSALTFKVGLIRFPLPASQLQLPAEDVVCAFDRLGSEDLAGSWELSDGG